MSFEYEKIKEYYDYDYWNTPGNKSGYTNMTAAIGGDWHRQACAWFDSVIPVKGKKLFDAGCGLGHFMVGFKELGADVYGCDVSDYCAGIVRSYFPENFFQTSLEDLEEVPENSFDIVITTSTLEHIPQNNIKIVIDNLIKITKPKGLIYIEVDVKPDKDRDMPEESHVNIQPWPVWLESLDSTRNKWNPEYMLTEKLRDTKNYPGFPLQDWRFFVFEKFR
ncbi:MAG: class I SAM-dependent methyltransferase [bacterium]|nr:class I SAM-dependent methyltransferase [bacterium]